MSTDNCGSVECGHCWRCTPGMKEPVMSDTKILSVEEFQGAIRDFLDPRWAAYRERRADELGAHDEALRAKVEKAEKERDEALHSDKAVMHERNAYYAELQAANGRAEKAEAELAQMTAWRDAAHAEMHKQLARAEDLAGELEKAEAEADLKELRRMMKNHACHSREGARAEQRHLEMVAAILYAPNRDDWLRIEALREAADLVKDNRSGAACREPVAKEAPRGSSLCVCAIAEYADQLPRPDVDADLLSLDQFNRLSAHSEDVKALRTHDMALRSNVACRNRIILDLHAALAAAEARIAGALEIQAGGCCGIADSMASALRGEP